MDLEPMRRSTHDIKHVDTPTHCNCTECLVAVNAQLVTYHETVKTRPGGCPPFCKLIHDKSEELCCEITCLTHEKKHMRLFPNAPFLRRCRCKDTVMLFFCLPAFQDENMKRRGTVKKQKLDLGAES